MRFIAIGLLLAGLAAGAAAGLAGCGTSAAPTSTETVCPTPDPMSLTWENFGMKFLADYCTRCHASTLRHAERNGAPLYHDYDSLMGMLELPDHVDQYAGAGPAAVNTIMPPDRCPSVPGGPIDTNCPKPTEEERKVLSMWVACEIERPH